MFYEIKELIIETLTNISGDTGSLLRYVFYKSFIKKSNGYFKSSCGFHMQGLKLISIGKECAFNRNVIISASDYVIIKDYVMVGFNTLIIDSNHGYSDKTVPMRYQKDIKKGITINDDVWIGSNCVILKGVNIGKGSIIGAGSILTKSVPEYEIWAGNPAKFIKKRIGL